MHHIIKIYKVIQEMMKMMVLLYEFFSKVIVAMALMTGLVINIDNARELRSG
jgi:hypothetical protein